MLPAVLLICMSVYLMVVCDPCAVAMPKRQTESLLEQEFYSDEMT